MGQHQNGPRFVLSAQHQPLLLATADQATTVPALAFGFVSTTAPAAPFAWLGSRRLGGAQLPFARSVLHAASPAQGMSNVRDPPVGST